MQSKSLEKTRIREYGVVLASLLHDIGKPLQRCDWKERKYVSFELVKKHFKDEKICEVYSKHLEIGDKYIPRDHEKYSESVLKLMLEYINRKQPIKDKPLAQIYSALEEAFKILTKEKTYLLNYIKFADYYAAAERAPEYMVVSAHETHGLSPQEAPFASPLWLWKIKSSNELWKKFRDIFHKMEEVKSKEEAKEYISLIREILQDAQVFKEPYFIPPRILTWKNMITWNIGKEKEPISQYSFMSLEEAVKTMNSEKSYRAVADSLLGDIKKLLDLAINKLVDIASFIETLLSILKKNLFLVPAGVYYSLMPDTSLYAHLKTVAAIAHASIIFGEKVSFKLIGIDINGIQNFIRLVAQNKGASKLLRGKSLLVELIQRAITTHILRNLELTWSNVIFYEGGKVLIIAPTGTPITNIKVDLRNFIVNDLRNELGITVADSPSVNKPLSFSHIVKCFEEKIEKGTFTRALMELTDNFEEEKYRPAVLPGIVLENYESCKLTKMPVSKQEALRYDENAEYFRELVPEALEQGDVISPLTHKCIVLGHVARNLRMIVQITMSDRRKYEELVSKIVKCFNEILEGKAGENTRYWHYSDKQLSARIGLIEFNAINTMYLLLSQVDEEYISPWMFLVALLNIAGKVFETTLGKNDAIKFIVINHVEDFIPPLNIPSLNIVRDMCSKGVNISYDYWFTNTFHPVDKEGKIKDLDKIAESDTEVPEMIAVGKVDGDNIGKLIFFLSLSPSRAATVSELIQFYFGGLTYALIRAHNVAKNSKIPNYEKTVVILYGGGDDMVVYGAWRPTIHYLTLVRLGMDKVLYPLTASSGVTIDDPRVPIALLYRWSVDLLEDYAKTFNGKNNMTLFRNPLPHVHDFSRNMLSISYGASFNEVKKTMEKIKEVKESKIPITTFYKLYSIAEEVSKILSSMLRIASPRDFRTQFRLKEEYINEIAIRAIVLQYMYNRVLRDPEIINELKTLMPWISNVLDKLEQGKSVEALMELNKKLPLLALLINALRKVR